MKLGKSFLKSNKYVSKTSLKVEDLLSLLSKCGTVKILELAKHGIKLDAKSHLKANISKRHYNSVIADLSKAGLVEKKNDKYFQTPFGKILYRKYIPQLKKAFISGRRCHA